MPAQIKAVASPQNVLLAYIVAVFMLGGGAREDIASLALLRPISVGVLGYALVVADFAKLRANSALLWLAAAWTMLVASHLVPLPPAIWQSLPGRELAVSIDQVVGLDESWRPISLVPFRTLNSLLSLTVPLAALVLALNLTREQLKITVYALLALGFVSALMSLLQVIGGPGNVFYLYRVTNAESAVGLFANRNHNAIMLALTIVMLGAAYVLRQPPRELQRSWSMLLGGLALSMLPFLIITQSRAGLGLGVLALAASWWLQRSSSASRRSIRRQPMVNPLLVAGAIGALSLAAVTYLFTAGNALSRLSQGGGADDELRLAIWPPTLDLIAAHFPFGSGIGTFVEVYEVAEPASTLGTSYINHAHSDFLEVLMTGGVPAALILLAGVIWLAFAGFRALGTANPVDRTLRRLGLVVIIIFAIGSAYDYPLRTPSHAVLFVLALVWIAGQQPTPTDHKTAGRRQSAEDKSAENTGAVNTGAENTGAENKSRASNAATGV